MGSFTAEERAIDSISRYLKTSRFMKWFGRDYTPTARLILWANQEDNLSKEDLQDITGASHTPIVETLARLVKEGLLRTRESGGRHKYNLYSVNYHVMDQRVREKFFAGRQTSQVPLDFDIEL